MLTRSGLPVQMTVAQRVHLKYIVLFLSRRAAFGQEPDTDSTYMPHLSLIYGDLPMPSREAVQHEVEPNLMGLPVELDSIQVWCTEGVVSEWKLLRSFPLKDS